MYEFFLALFVFFTIFIDTLSILLKGTSTDKDLAKVYMVSQALTYITRFSLFFILPIIGLILDEVIFFKLSNFLLFLSFFMMLHSVIYIFKYKVVISNAPHFIVLFNKSMFDFAKYGFTNLFTNFNKNDNESLRIGIKFQGINFMYAASHFFLALIFPAVLIIGEYLPHYRGVLMGSMSVYTGVFSIYITFFIERKIPYLGQEKRTEYVDSLVNAKILTSLVVFVFILLLCFVKYV